MTAAQLSSLDHVFEYQIGVYTIDSDPMECKAAILGDNLRL